ncbi:MAG: P-II family nitrogen regulator [Bacilli bacterium]
MNNECEIITVVVDSGKADKVIKAAKSKGVTGATIVLGKGSADNKILQFLGLSETRKEIVFMVVHRSIVKMTLDFLKETFHFDKPNKGIAFSMKLDRVLGLHVLYQLETLKQTANGGMKDKMYKAIFTVIDRGKAEAVMDSAKSAGARGGTIINGRGSGIHEQKTLFSFPIEHEKEIVLIIAKTSDTEKIVKKIHDDLKINDPGKGIMFVLDVDQAYGL